MQFTEDNITSMVKCKTSVYVLMTEIYLEWSIGSQTKKSFWLTLYRYEKVKVVADEWVKKVDTLVKEWKLLDNTVNELNSWVAQDRQAEGEQNFSLEKMESTLGELKNIFKEKEKLVENL